MNLKMIVMIRLLCILLVMVFIKSIEAFLKKNNGKITLSELNQLESKMNDSSKRKDRKAKTLKY